MRKFFGNKESKTFRPQKTHAPGTKRWHLHSRAAELLREGSGAEAVKLPPGEDTGLEAYVGGAAVDFFNDINLLYGGIQDVCTAESCPVMCAGRKYEYHWADGAKYKTPTRLSAPDYMEHLMGWVASLLDSDRLFPATTDKPFPKGFRKRVATIFRRLFRVYAHIYYSHYEDIRAMDAEPHLNAGFAHFILFVLEFDLIPKEEMRPMRHLIRQLVDEAASPHAPISWEADDEEGASAGAAPAS